MCGTAVFLLLLFPHLFPCSFHSPGGLCWKKCQMITLLQAPSGSSCTYSSATHISHSSVSLLHYSSALNLLFCRKEVKRGHSLPLPWEPNKCIVIYKWKYVSNLQLWPSRVYVWVKNWIKIIKKLQVNIQFWVVLCNLFFITSLIK